MRKRPKPTQTTADGVPADIANGPHVLTWAAQEDLDRLDATREDDPNRQDLVWAAMLSARRNWSRARLAWLAANEIPDREQCKLIPLRAPRW